MGQIAILVSAALVTAIALALRLWRTVARQKADLQRFEPIRELEAHICEQTYAFERQGLSRCSSSPRTLQKSAPIWTLVEVR